MHKKNMFLICCLVLLAQSVFAEEIGSLEFIKKQYGSGETVQVRITTLPLEQAIKPEQLALYINGVKKPMAPFFTRYDEQTYLLYFDLPVFIEGQAMLKIERLLYKGSQGLEEGALEKEIPISTNTTSVLSIVPAFIILAKEQNEFQVRIENKKGVDNMNISASQGITNLYLGSQAVNRGVTRTFKFKVAQDELGDDAAITLLHGEETYTLPVLKYKQPKPIQQTEINNTLQDQPLVFVAANQEINRTITKETSLQGTLSIMNQGNESIKDIVLELTGNLGSLTTLDTTVIPSLLPGEMKDIFVSINAEKNTALGVYEGFILAKAANMRATFPVKIIVEAVRPEQEVNRTTIDLGLQNPQIEQQRPEERKILPLPEEKEYPFGLIIVTMLLVLLAIGFYFMKRKPKEKEERFDELLRRVKK